MPLKLRGKSMADLLDDAIYLGHLQIMFDKFGTERHTLCKFWCCLQPTYDDSRQYRLDTLCKFASRVEFNILTQRTRSRCTQHTLNDTHVEWMPRLYVNRWLWKCYYYWVDARLRRKRTHPRRTDSYVFSSLLRAERTASVAQTHTRTRTRIPKAQYATYSAFNKYKSSVAVSLM